MNRNKVIHTYIHNLTLSCDNEFAKRFNYVSWLWGKAVDETIPAEKREFYMKEHFDSKLALEQGYPISFLNEYN